MDIFRKTFPCLVGEVNWGPVRAKFEMARSPSHISSSLISNDNIIPYTNKGYLVFQVENGDWELAGGTLERGESFQQALHREVREELGAEIKSFTIFGLFSCTSSAEKPFRPHLPHPNFIRLVGFGEVKITQKPINPPRGEKVVRIEIVGIEEACRRFEKNQRFDLAELYRLTDLIRKGENFF